MELLQVLAARAACKTYLKTSGDTGEVQQIIIIIIIIIIINEHPNYRMTEVHIIRVCA